jgi:hypothetical protein
MSFKKGAACSINGKKYELQVFNIVKNCYINDKLFNTQDIKDLGYCNSKNDIECNYLITNDIPIEIKKCKTPDWMQCSLKYDDENKNWIGSSKNKIPDKSKQIFEELIADKILFNGNIPPFIYNNITYDEWVKIKKENDYNDIYIDCPNTTIRQLYAEKGCYYIQISEKGLYHLGNDICNFNVPEFICEQQLRIRIKVHSRKNNKGHCNLSITIACQPKKIKDLIDSSYSLDNKDKLPLVIYYNNLGR